MSDAKKLVNRIPFESIETISNWSLPSLGDPARSIPTAQREAQRPPTPASKMEVEEVADTMAVKPMTAEQLQTIAAEAEREGREHGYQEGLQKGLQEGQKQGQKSGEQKAYNECKARWQDETLRLRQIADRLLTPLEQQETALENVLVEMALKFAEHLLHKTIDQDPGTLYSMVEKAVAGIPAGAKNLRIYLNPDDLELLISAVNFVPPEWSLNHDRALQRGGCRVESQYSLVDYSVEKRLAQLFEQARALGTAAVDAMPLPVDHKPAVPDKDQSQACEAANPFETEIRDSQLSPAVADVTALHESQESQESDELRQSRPAPDGHGWPV